MRLRTLLIEDERMFAELLNHSLSSANLVEIIATVSSVKEAKALLKPGVADLVVLDWHLPDGLGADVLDAISALNDNTLVIILSSDPEGIPSRYRLRSCVSKLIPKATAYTNLIDVIRTILASRAGDQDVPGFDALTEKERLVLQMIGSGKTSKQIAEEISRSVETVNTHRKNICRKLGVSGSEMLIMAAQFKLNYR